MQSSVRQAGTKPARAPAAPCRLQTHQIVECRRYAPEPAVSEPSANGTTPAATRTADPELEPPLTYSRLNTQPGLPYGLRVPTKPGGKLVQVGFADDDRTGREQALDDVGRGGWPIAECRAGRRRLDAGHIDVVLDCDGYASERQRLSRRDTLIHLARSGEHCFAGTRLIQASG